MTQIQSGFIRAIDNYTNFRKNRETVYISNINSNIKKLEDFIDSNKDAIIEGIAVTKVLNEFYNKYNDDLTDNKVQRINLNSNYDDIYSFDDDKFILGNCYTSIMVVCDLDNNEKVIHKHYYLNVRYDDPIPINRDFNELCADMLGDCSRRFDNFTTKFFDKLERTNFVSIEHDLLIKLEHFEKLITQLKG